MTNIPNAQHQQSGQQANNFHLIRSVDQINGLITKRVPIKPQSSK